MKIRISFLILCVLSSYLTLAQTKHALLIGVGNYPKNEESGTWKSLSSKNDIILVNKMLSSQGFDSKNIVELIDQEATVDNVFKHFDDLIEKIQAGDIVYFHYSGHGQQVSDIDPRKHKKYAHIKHLKADESDDGFDEALALYNAPINYTNNYDFSNHLIDDQIEYYQKKIQKILGKNGHLIMVFDACHSGSITRGNQFEPVYRSESKKCLDPDIEVIKQPEKIDQINPDFGLLVEFKGCRDNQKNLEVQMGQFGSKMNYGSLSYFLYQAMTELGTKATYQKVFDKVYNKIYSHSKGKQEPVLKTTNANQLFFGTGNLIMPREFNVSPTSNLKQLQVSAGMIHGIQIGDSLAVFRSSDSEKKLLSGIVTEVFGSECMVSFDKTITFLSNSKNSENHYTYFSAKRTYSNQPGQELYIAFDIDKNKGLQKKITQLFEAKPNIHFLSKVESGVDYIIKGDKSNRIKFMIPGMEVPFRDMSELDLSTEKGVDSLKAMVKDILVLEYFSSLQLSDERIKLDIQLKEFDTATYQSFIDNNPNLIEPFSALKLFNLRFKNTSNQKLYVYPMHLSNSMVYKEVDKDNFPIILPVDEIKEIIFGTAQSKILPNEGLENLVVLTSLKEISLNYLLESSKSLDVKTRGNDKLSDQLKNGVNGKSSKVNTNAGMSIERFPFKIDYILQ